MASPRLVRLTVEANGEQASGHVARFDGHKGPAFLRRVLEEAGLTEGEFVYHMVAWFKSSGFTKPVQPRRFDNVGVHLWLKPAGNGSAVKGVLVADKAHYTPEEVFRRLKTYVEGTPAPAVPPALDDPTTELLLLAVNAANGAYHKTQDEFDSAVLGELRACSYEADGETLDRMTEAAKARGFLDYSSTTAVVTLEGQAWLDDPARKPGGEEPPPAPPTPAPAPPPTDSVALIQANRAKLERLLALPELVGQCRTRQATLAANIATLRTSLDEAESEELALLAEIDDVALRSLLGG